MNLSYEEAFLFDNRFSIQITKIQHYNVSLTHEEGYEGISFDELDRPGQNLSMKIYDCVQNKSLEFENINKMTEKELYEFTINLLKRILKKDLPVA